MRWEEGFPLGNGRLGVMLWGDGSPLRLTLDHADLWDLRRNESFMEHPDFSYAGLRRLVAEGRFGEAQEVFEEREKRDNPIGPTKISIGRAELQLGEGQGAELTFDIDRALVEGRLPAEEGARSIEAFVHRERDLFCLRVRGSHAAEAELRLVPLAEMTPQMAGLGHPPPTTEHDGRVTVVRQELVGGPGYAVAWNVAGPERYLAVELAADPSAAATRAKAAVGEAMEAGFAALRRQHLEGWRAFWASSAVALPEPRVELLWYLGVYILASCARRGSLPPGLQGVWAMDGVMPPWRGDYHADMNVQEVFWPACSSGHLDLLDSWCDHMRATLPRAQAFCRRFFGTEGSFWTATALPDLVSVPCWYTVEYAWSSVGWLAWLVWLRWRHSLDTEWLGAVGYPLIAEVFRFYRANLEQEADGRLHIPLSSSPEYREDSPQAWCKDPAIDIALVRRCCEWVAEMEAALGRRDLTAAAREVREHLTPYPLTEARVLCLWPGKPLDESHRHPSHLMAIHPAMDLTVEGGDEERAIIGASVQHFWSLGQYRWAGHSYAQLISLAAVIGRPGWAYDSLLQFAEHWIGPNGLHFNADLAQSGMSCYRYPPGAYGPFTIEANCAVAAGIGDMLVQGWGDRVRIFPAVPNHWRDVAFRDMLTEGAFRVSAAREEGRTIWVSVRATADRLLRLRDPFGGQATVMHGAEVRREGEDLVADLVAGQTLMLALPGAHASFPEAARRVGRRGTSRLGLSPQ